jgi:hypothetical protein
MGKQVHTIAIGQLVLLIRWPGCSDFDICECHAYPLTIGTSIIEPEIPSSAPRCVGRCKLKSADLKRVNIARKAGKCWILGIKKDLS